MDATPSIRRTWLALGDFLAEHNRDKAGSHWERGMGERSYTVPMVTVNCRRQALQKQTPARTPRRLVA